MNLVHRRLGELCRELKKRRMTKLIKLIPLVLCLQTFGLFDSLTAVTAQVRHEPTVVYSQTQGEITVRIEKILIERIYNEPAWLDGVDKGVADGIQRRLPAKGVTSLFSVIGDVKEYGPVKINFANKQEVDTFSAYRFFSPSKWRPRLPRLKIEPNASGVESYFLVDAHTKTSELFPAQIEIEVTTSAGKKIAFKFKDVDF